MQATKSPTHRSNLQHIALALSFRKGEEEDRTETENKRKLENQELLPRGASSGSAIEEEFFDCQEEAEPRRKKSQEGRNASSTEYKQKNRSASSTELRQKLAPRSNLQHWDSADHNMKMKQ